MIRSIGRCSGFLVILCILLLSCILTSGCLKESVLSVRGMSVGAERVDPSRVILSVTTEIENHEGFGSGTPRLQLRVYNVETGILEAERTNTLEGIPWGGSRIVTQTIEIPRKGSYRLVATVYEGEKRKAQGEITAYNLDRLVPDSQKTGLVIGDIDFIARKVSGDFVDIQADIYIENADPAPSDGFDVEVKAKEMDARLVADKRTVHVDSIDPWKILVVPVTLTVPDQYNYAIEVLFWKNGTIIKRGEGTVQLRPGTTLPAGGQFVTRKIETSKFVSEQGSGLPGVYPTPALRAPGFSGFLAFMAFSAAGGVAILWRRRR